MRPSAPPPSAPTSAPQVLGRCGTYELLFELATGGMATVYLAHPVDAGERAQLVAIKRPHRHLAKDKMFLTMLVDEARLASAIDHPNVVRVRELGFEGGEPFIVLDYVEGASLAELRRELASAERAVDTRVAVRVVLDALAGLHAAHELRDATGRHLAIIHRDVSPHNVLLGCDGRVRLTDFGIAKAEDRMQETQTHEVKGKLAYLAPERIDKRRQCTVQSDVFSMAVVLWECIAGRRLFRGEEAVDTLQEVLHAPIPRLRQLGADIPPALDDAIARGLARDLAARWQTAKEFADAIEIAARPTHLGDREDVARVMETVFGPRLAFRHEEARTAVGDRAFVDRLLQQTGVAPRPGPTPDTPLSSPLLYASIAPPAPSERYAFGNIVDSVTYERRRLPWPLIGAVVAGGVAGAVAVGLLVSRIVAHDASGAAEATAAATAAGEASQASADVRRVVVTLPFAAAHVTFDDMERDLSPPADVSAFDVPHASGTRHRVVAIAPDGARGEAYVHEEDGVARPESPYRIGAASAAGGAPATALEMSTAVAHGAAGPRAMVVGTAAAAHAPVKAAPIGTTKNGFTKLK